MSNFWTGFEKRGARVKMPKAKVPKPEGFVEGVKRMGGEALSGTGRAMDSVGKWVGDQSKALNAHLPKSVQKFNTGMVNRIKANPVKSSLIGMGTAYGAGKMMSSPSQPQTQYNNYVM